MKITSADEYEKWEKRLNCTSSGFTEDMLILIASLLITILRRLEANHE